MPRFAAETQLAGVAFGIVRRSAASSKVRPCEKTTFTASSRNSGAQVFDRVISSPVGEVYQTGGPEKVRVTSSQRACANRARQNIQSAVPARQDEAGFTNTADVGNVAGKDVAVKHNVVVDTHFLEILP